MHELDKQYIRYKAIALYKQGLERHKIFDFFWNHETLERYSNEFLNVELKKILNEVERELYSNVK